MVAFQLRAVQPGRGSIKRQNIVSPKWKNEQIN